jgi:gentisate 1,2-dioxygenase
MIQATKTMAVFDRELAELNIRGEWKFNEVFAAMKDGPKPASRPLLWAWKTIHEKLLEACDVMPESQTARRNFTYCHPDLPRPGTTSTIAAGVQIVKPGEVAWTHRHTIGALRFGIAGDDELYTVVNGTRLPMKPNDLVLTPSWAWHDHHNDSTANGIWLDVLDVPLMFALNTTFFESYETPMQPVRSERIGHHAILPAWDEQTASGGPVLRYPWEDVRAEIDAHQGAAGSPHDDLLFEYRNPATGGSTLPTLGCSIHALRPGFAGSERRRTASAVYYVVKGSGTTVCGDTTIAWNERDVFSMPEWTWHRHRNASAGDEAILFSVTDEPVLATFGLAREEVRD